jgi:hypothetical protein
MQELVEDYPDIASTEEYGTTTEGRRIRAFVIRRGAPKRTIIVEAALRPRLVSIITFLEISYEKFQQRVAGHDDSHVHHSRDC